MFNKIVVFFIKLFIGKNDANRRYRNFLKTYETLIPLVSKELLNVLNTRNTQLLIKTYTLNKPFDRAFLSFKNDDVIWLISHQNEYVFKEFAYIDLENDISILINLYKNETVSKI